jgi:hypothetical protein
MEVATGELLKTMETVAGERSRCSTSILGVAGLSMPGRFFLLSSCSAGMDVQHVATVVHLGWRGAHEKFAGSEVVKRKELLGNYKLSTNR